MFETTGDLASVSCTRRGCNSHLVDYPPRLRARLRQLGWLHIPREGFNGTQLLCPSCVLTLDRAHTGEIA